MDPFLPSSPLVQEYLMPRNSFAANPKRFDALLAEFLDAAAENLAPDEKLLMQRMSESDQAAEILRKYKMTTQQNDSYRYAWKPIASQ
jgi:hypothetical protein